VWKFSRATLDGWVLKAGELLIPMASAMRQELCYLPECVQPVATWDNPTLQRVVYNQKRHWTFLLGTRMVTFERRFDVARQLSPEFLLIDLVNELGDLAEDLAAVFSRVREKAKEMDPRKFHGQSLSTANTPPRKSFRRCCTMPPS
jgi:hypothetical protein